MEAKLAQDNMSVNEPARSMVPHFVADQFSPAARSRCSSGSQEPEPDGAFAFDGDRIFRLDCPRPCELMSEFSNRYSVANPIPEAVIFGGVCSVSLLLSDSDAWPGHLGDRRVAHTAWVFDRFTVPRAHISQW